MHKISASNGSYAVIYGRHSINKTCTAVLSSQNVGYKVDGIFSFWYHMNGNGIGRLAVYVIDGRNRQQVWQKKGRQSPDWLHANIVIKPGDFRVRFSKYLFLV